MCAGPRAAFARASRVAYGGSSPPATLSMIPGKCYATIQLLTYLYRFQVFRVVPGERLRHHALLSLGATLSHPCRLPPPPPPSTLLHNLFPTIPRILPQSTALPHPAPTPDERVQPEKRTHCHARSRVATPATQTQSAARSLRVEVSPWYFAQVPPSL